MTDTITFTQLGLSGTGVVKQTGAKAFAVGEILTTDVTNFNSVAAAAAPVQTVAGRTGAVTLAESDIANLTSDLASKLNLSGGTMTGALTLSGDATQSLQPVSYQQFQVAIAGFSPKAACRLFSASNLVGTYNNGTSGVGATLTLSSTGVVTIDGQNVVFNDRVCLNGQTTQLQNGIYVCTTPGSAGVAAVFTRATDYDNSPSGEVVAGTYTNITAGTTYAGTFWYMTTTGTITVGTSNIVFAQATLPILGTGLTQSSPNTIAIANTGVTSGTYGDAAHSLALNVNAQGQLTSLTSNSIQITESQVTNLTSDLSVRLITTNNLSDLANISTARSNLGLGSIATQNANSVNITGTVTGNLYGQILTDTTTARTLSPTDIGSINFTNAATVTVTIDSDANQPIPNGAIFILQNQGGANSLLQTATSGAFVSAGGNLANGGSIVVGQYGYIILQKLGVNNWIVETIYEQITFMTKFVWGGYTTISNQPIRLMRNGQMIKIEFPPMGNFSSSQTAYLISSSQAPARFRPGANISGSGFVSFDNGTTQTASRYAMDNNGYLYITSTTGSNFPAATEIKTEGYSLIFSN